jgi:hypothetical protein
MSLLTLLHTLSAWAPIVFIRDSKYGMPAVQSVHLMGLTMMLATVVIIDLQLAGAGMMGWSPPQLWRQLKPWTLGGMTAVVLSGIFIFLATPDKYLGSNPFRVKMAALCLAILFHFLVLRRAVTAGPGSRPRRVNVTIACLSLTLWFCVGWAGRAIAFVP